MFISSTYITSVVGLLYIRSTFLADLFFTAGMLSVIGDNAYHVNFLVNDIRFSCCVASAGMLSARQGGMNYHRVSVCTFPSYVAAIVL
jgi:hypothetical protein